MQLRMLLLLTSLALNGCASLPPFPEVLQCGYLPQYGKFRCVNTQTHAKLNLRLDDPTMRGAQCLSPNDYKKSEAWVADVVEIAKQKCH